MAGRIIEYAVFYSDSGRDFATNVTLTLNEGWELYGDLKLSSVYGSRVPETNPEVIMTFAQAVVRREPESG